MTIAAPCSVRLGGIAFMADGRPSVTVDHAMYVADLTANLFSQQCAVSMSYKDPVQENEWLIDAVHSGADVAIRVDGDCWAPVGAHPTHHIYRAALVVMFAASLDRDRAATYMSLDERDHLAANFDLDSVAMLGVNVAVPGERPSDDWRTGTHRSMHHEMPMADADWQSPIESVGRVSESFAIYNCAWFRRHLAVATTPRRVERVKNSGGIVLSALAHSYRWPATHAFPIGVEPAWAPG